MSASPTSPKSAATKSEDEYFVRRAGQPHVETWTPPDPSSRMRFLLERANAAEDRADELQRETDMLKSNIKAALNMDPTSATAALAWIGRAERAEELLREVLRLVTQRSLRSVDLPPGWVARAEAQLQAVEILRRDQEELMERPEGGDYWSTAVNSQGRRTVMRDDAHT